ncbi:LOW QUALITY PROTEIN: probable protein phosphatase 2C 35 [Asparagus officinalis]|uniref:LOW QUALITY PROTEIN: probable protein phosphatase 2C 35 n=1 Tax=Asparagus officinalis TaxID=4686 RepID=UPI00098E79D8|nr:LOW QUALITY PROTEIN: probable protein phosphatase 2C 35 [Asparagus officinalis]
MIQALAPTTLESRSFEAFRGPPKPLLRSSDIDDFMSGTTAGRASSSAGAPLQSANVGDSRAVAGVRNAERNCVLAEDLSSDQTPFRKDEYERVRGCGARVLSVDQVEGVKDPEVQSWGAEEDDEGDPPRLWVQSGLYPGTAFTRSVGAVPEVKEVKITPEHLFFVVASDGVYEFLSSQTVVNMVAGFKDPRDACAAIAAESYKTWLEHESRTDDITLIVVHIKYMGNSDYAMTEETSEISSKTSPVALEKLPVYRYAFQGSGKSTELHACPDFTMERSPACVAPSPGHTPSSRT